ncbi:hypothetical protein F5Y18DRAFT_142291 [Xylariaceae sp. FL1019]|nr:hypothetical protein F5Y18DRAFT_142291 [Xylariaceae sp. FL1019]
MASSPTRNLPSSLHQPSQRGSQHSSLQPPTPSRRSPVKKSTTASTPNLNTLYSAHSRLTPAAGSLARKASLAALTPGSLASIPDDSESYAYNSVLNESTTDGTMPPPLTPGKNNVAADAFSVGEQVDVPGNMVGTVRFVGIVAGKKGLFAGVELNQEFAARGKNNGEVDGVSYFTTSAPSSGIFVPLNKLYKHDSASAYPTTPGSGLSGLRAATQNTTNFTPPTPSLPKFSQSVGPGRAPSPQGKRAPRTSLPRPDSPVRKLQLPPASRPSITTPGPKPSARYGSPTVPKFGSSVRGTAGDPNKSMRLDRRPSIAPPRSASALGQTSSKFDLEEQPPKSAHSTTNGSIASMGPMGSVFKRPASRAQPVHDEELERLRSQLEERDKLLKEQASALAEMESSLSELTVLIDQSGSAQNRPSSMDGKDTSQLRAMLREKNEKIIMLTTEFDAHRADFRSTIDTLEMASTETQRVYDAKIRELEHDLQEAQDRNADVNAVATQLKMLEELVQELEEGLEDSRRGEAEARGEVEFLRGEVERTRSELRRERDKASTVTNGANNGDDRSSTSKDLEQKDDEIRGLKAIIHSLSRDSIPGDASDKTSQRNSSLISRQDSMSSRNAKEKMERELAEMRTLLENKNAREEELEREVETLRRRSVPDHRGSTMTAGSADRSSYRDSKGTVVLARDLRSPEKTHRRNQSSKAIPESDTYSSVTETSTLWCEICETAGHDILTCTNMFGEQSKSSGRDAAPESHRNLAVPVDAEATPRPLSPMKPKAPVVPSLPSLSDSSPLAGKESGVIDPAKWCAMCERDGHDSIDCPLEDAF